MSQKEIGTKCWLAVWPDKSYFRDSYEKSIQVFDNEPAAFETLRQMKELGYINSAIIPALLLTDSDLLEMRKRDFEAAREGESVSHVPGGFTEVEYKYNWFEDYIKSEGKE